MKESVNMADIASILPIQQLAVDAVCVTLDTSLFVGVTQGLI